MARMYFHVTDDLAEEVRHRAESRGMTVSAYLTEIVQRHLIDPWPEDFFSRVVGGWVGARLTIEHPDRIEKLVMNTPGGLNAEPEVMERLKRLTLEAVSPPTYEKVQKRVEWLFLDPASVPPDLVETRLRIYSQPGYRESTERTLCLQEMEVRQRNMLRAEDLNAIKVPVLLVWSSHDPIAGTEVGKWTRDNIPDVTYVQMENSGHWPQFEEAEKFNREHLRFLGVEVD